MAKVYGKLNPKSVSGSLPLGRHSDGGNLYLLVDASGARRWLFIYKWKGKQREMGLGALADVSLARAREKAAASRALIADGVDPLAAKEAARRIPTFGEFADEVLEGLNAGFSNAKHRAQWAMTLKRYAGPLRDIPIDKIMTKDVHAALAPIWTSKPETADRTRQRIERVLDAAAAKGYRDLDRRNPASWKGNLKHLLPARRKLTRGHHAAMPFAAAPGFYADLRSADSVSARALEFTMLTAARTGETLGARWSEIDLNSATWVIPGGRMKAKKEHRVPLCARALEILEDQARFHRGDIVFCNTGTTLPLSNMAMTMLLRDMSEHFITVDCKPRPATVHGFRSTFRDWAGTATDYPRELAEEALAHDIGNAVERAYRRADSLEKRRPMMNQWADHLKQVWAVRASSSLPNAEADGGPAAKAA